MRYIVIVCLLSLSLGNFSFADELKQRLVAELVDQLEGKSCKYEVRGHDCVERSPFAGWSRRHDKEECVVDAAKGLALIGPEAKTAVPALIEALKRNHNIDTGDGIIGLRSEIASALGQIGDLRAIQPLMEVLASDDPATISPSAAVKEAIDKISQKKPAHSAPAETYRTD